MSSAAPPGDVLPHHDAALDGLRALAVALVVLTHAAFLTGAVLSAGLLGRLFGRGDFGVAIFFALSGYLLHRGFLRTPASRGDIRGYYLRRAARVLPAYWVTLAVVALCAQPSGRDLVLHALAVQIYAPGSHLPAFSQSWSIATELSFYLVLPLAAAGLQRLRRRRLDLPLTVVAWALPVAVLISGLVPGADLDRDIPMERWLPARSACFLIGMLLAEARARPTHPLARRLRGLTEEPTVLLLLGGAAYLLATTPLAGLLTLGTVSGWQLATKMLLACVVAFAVLAPLVLAEPGGYARALARPVMSWLGRISYGIFLWHVPVFMALYAVSGVRPFTGGLAPLLALGVPITLALAALSHSWVELPLMRWAARRSRRRPSGAAPSTPASRRPQER